MQLYWVTTEDHHEDWFIVASTAGDATTFHEEEEGYDYGEASAKKILKIPQSMSTNTGWPSEELLCELGAKFLRLEQPRVVEITGKKYCEGLMESIVLEKQSEILKSQNRD